MTKKTKNQQIEDLANNKNYVRCPDVQGYRHVIACGIFQRDTSIRERCRMFKCKHFKEVK